MGGAQDVHDMVAAELHGPILDVGCGEGRLASLLPDGVRWIGVDSSPSQLATKAKRVLRTGGRYYASTGARDNDPEIMFEGYPPSSFDAEEAVFIVESVFGNAEPDRWDSVFFPLETLDEVHAYCRHHFIPAERAEMARDGDQCANARYTAFTSSWLRGSPFGSKRRSFIT